MTDVTTKPLAEQTPPEIDEQLFPLWVERWQTVHYIYDYRRSIAPTLFPGSELIEYERGARRKARGIGEFQLNDWGRRLNATEDKLAEIDARIEPIDAEFDRRGGWSRYLLVGGGHLHRWHGCSSLRPTTQTFLLAESSGLTDAEVVARYSYTACTKCFPDAPVAGTPTLDTSIYCPGSGQQGIDVNGSKSLWRSWGRCPECGKGQSTSSLGKLRRHKRTQT